MHDTPPPGHDAVTPKTTATADRPVTRGTTYTDPLSRDKPPDDINVKVIGPGVRMSVATCKDYDAAIIDSGPDTTATGVVDIHAVTAPGPFAVYRNDPTGHDDRSRLFFSPPHLPSHSDYTSILGPVITDTRTGDGTTTVTIRDRGDPRATAKVTVDTRKDVPQPGVTPHFASTKLNTSTAFNPSVPNANKGSVTNSYYTTTAITYNVASNNYHVTVHYGTNLVIKSAYINTSTKFRTF